MDSCALFTYKLTGSVLGYAGLGEIKNKKHAYFVTAGGKCVNEKRKTNQAQKVRFSQLYSCKYRILG